jgi:hypothetical protein
MITIRTLIASSLLGVCSLAFALPAGATDVKSKDQIDAEFSAANDKCDALSGKQKDACKARAKADREKALADAKVGKVEAEANHDAVKERRNADYKAAKAHCDTLSGDAEDKCVADAKAKYHQ